MLNIRVFIFIIFYLIWKSKKKNYYIIFSLYKKKNSIQQKIILSYEKVEKKINMKSESKLFLGKS